MRLQNLRKVFAAAVVFALGANVEAENRTNQRYSNKQKVDRSEMGEVDLRANLSGERSALGPRKLSDTLAKMRAKLQSRFHNYGLTTSSSRKPIKPPRDGQQTHAKSSARDVAVTPGTPGSKANIIPRRFSDEAVMQRDSRIEPEESRLNRDGSDASRAGKLDRP